MSDEGRELKAAVEYKTDLFDADTIRRMLQNFNVLLQNIVTQPDQRISQLPVLTSQERQRVLDGWNETEREYPSPFSIHQLFRAQAARTPHAPAVLHPCGHALLRSTRCPLRCPRPAPPLARH